MFIAPRDKPGYIPHAKLVAQIISESIIANECGRPSDAMALTRHAVQDVGEPRIQIDLDEDGDGEEADDGRLGNDLLALKTKQQHQSGLKCDKRDRL